LLGRCFERRVRSQAPHNIAALQFSLCTHLCIFYRFRVIVQKAINFISKHTTDTFWATVCKTVRPVLSDRCLSCLSVTFVHCAQTVGRIKMKLDTQVGLGPGHNLLDRDPAPPPQRGAAPKFSAYICCGQMAEWIKMPLGMELGLSPGDLVLDRDPARP